jgi:LacI family transcriptional regulator
MKSSSKPSIKDIAARAGVSPTTVSHALNDATEARVAEATRARVKRVAEEMGYAPNGFARALRTNRSYAIALLSDVVATTPYAGDLVRGAHEAAIARGFVLMIVTTNYDPRVEEQTLNVLNQRQVDGVIIAAVSHRVIQLPTGLWDVPVVVANARAADTSVPSVFPDEFHGGYLATRTLIDRGHTKVGLVLTDEIIPAREGRLHGYRTALRERGIAFRPEWVASGYSDTDGGYAAASELLALPDRPSALFCFNDRMAMGAYRAARKAGLSIPADLSVLGFDNLEIIAAALDPPLTTVALPYYEMGAWAVNRLIDAILGDDAVTGQPVQVPLRGNLVYRNSVMPVT